MDTLDEVLECVSTLWRLAIGTDFNGRVSEGNRGDEELLARYGVEERNDHSGFCKKDEKWLQ